MATSRCTHAHHVQHQDRQSLRQEALQEEGRQKVSLYRNINNKKKRIAAGSGEKMRKPGQKGAPTASAFKAAAKTAKKRKKR
ncbi:MAG: hypothetical protein CL959_01885 [Euryarchaeota archaeon]|nr:hypothetical protein [Euryarchaeota archaeon]